MEKAFDNMQAPGFRGLGAAFKEAESRYHINAVILAGIAGNESAWGTSSIARQKNNLFGWRAYTSDPSQAQTFRSKRECILFIAERFWQRWVIEQGRMTLRQINQNYASDTGWGQKAVDCARGILTWHYGGWEKVPRGKTFADYVE
jgi:beta-N-acetylglucosaminidase